MLQLHSDLLTVRINPAGAELCSITDRQGTEYIWQADAAVWPRHAPVLFPIVGRLKENAFDYQGQRYNLGQHGFARDLEFKTLESDQQICTLELTDSAETSRIYPFDFTLRIGYALQGNGLTCNYTVINPATMPLLFSLGAHPGFNCPLQAGERFEDYYLEFESDQLTYTELENGLRTDRKQALNLNNNKLFLSAALFDRDALVFEQGQINRIGLRSSVSSHAITLECQGWPYFGVWAKKGCTRFVCLEPWYGVADHVDATGQLAEKAGIIRLEGGQTFACSYAIRLQ